MKKNYNKRIILLLLVLFAIISASFYYLNQKEKKTNLYTISTVEKQKQTFYESKRNIEYSKRLHLITRIKEKVNKRKEMSKKLQKLRESIIESSGPEKEVYEALVYNDFEYFKKLYNQGIDLKSLTFVPDYFMEIAGYFLEDVRILELLLEHDFKIENTYAMRNALETRNFLFLDYLINEKNKISYKLSVFGEKDLENFIGNNGGEYSDYDRENFVLTIKDFSEENLNKYIDEGFVFTNENLSLLLNRASRMGISPEELENLNRMLDLNKNFRDAHENNSLLAAIDSDKTTLNSIKWFVENNYSINQKNKFGENALSIAIRNKKEDVILYLLKNNMSVNGKITIRGKFNKETKRI